MTNTEIAESAESAPLCGVVAPASCELVENLHEYSFNAADGSPEGSIFAENIDEAAELFALENPDFDWIEVWSPGDSFGRWYRIQHERDGVRVWRSNPEPDVGA